MLSHRTAGDKFVVTSSIVLKPGGTCITDCGSSSEALLVGSFVSSFGTRSCANQLPVLRFMLATCPHLLRFVGL